ncbi:hypothetical protein KIPB_010774 [Kipferlia bialata]|uniref:EF-hand domain-containing protein n=1 Tax=Kipferlia bialata TaxID=797122 RepID=A0A9K3GN65_9EUKA|nr:hypothetical protein KIPB_010774 [Kipferlia bialata]|eukprot:g10774.t1
MIKPTSIHDAERLMQPLPPRGGSRAFSGPRVVNRAGLTRTQLGEVLALSRECLADAPPPCTAVIHNTYKTKDLEARPQTTAPTRRVVPPNQGGRKSALERAEGYDAYFDAERERQLKTRGRNTSTGRGQRYGMDDEAPGLTLAEFGCLLIEAMKVDGGEDMGNIQWSDMIPLLEHLDQDGDGYIGDSDMENMAERITSFECDFYSEEGQMSPAEAKLVSLYREVRR